MVLSQKCSYGIGYSEPDLKKVRLLLIAPEVVLP